MTHSTGDDLTTAYFGEDDRYIPEYLVAPVYEEEAAAAPAAAAESTEPVTEEQRVATAIANATSVGLGGMSPADRITVLTAIRDAVDGRLKWEKSGMIENLTGATQSKSIPTALGPLTFKPSTRPVKVDEDKLLEYVRENDPEQITERVVYEIDPDYRKSLIGAIIDLGDGDFALGTNGLAIDFAYLGNATSAQIAYPSSAEQKIVKAQARKALDEQFITLTSGMLDAANGDNL